MDPSRIGDLIPWRERRIDFDPPEKSWGFNPSILQLPDGRLLCALRCANYHRTMGLRLPSAITNRTFMLEIDPVTLRIATSIEIKDTDPRPKHASRIVGHDDLRLTWTTRDGLVAIANTAHFGNGHRRDMVVLDFDKSSHITGSTPLVGAWSGHQKNWTPFVGAEAVRLVYSVERGGIHTRDGRITAPSGLERYGLRGGSQLVPCDGFWIAIAHGITEGPRRGYWHMFYAADDDGRLLALSPAFKLCDRPIEFAAGLALDPASGRVIVSYGVEDDHAMLGVTELDAVLKTLRATAPNFEPLRGERQPT
jgi:hypothetical protein